MAETVAVEKKGNPVGRFFKAVGLAIVGFFAAIGRAFKNFFVNFGKRFQEGSIGTKLSHFIMGAGNFYHHQWVKGSLYLAFQILFIFKIII